MLILSRRLGEQILIGDNVVVTICKIEHGKVRVGVEAPREIRIVRREVARNESTGKEAPAEEPKFIS